MRKGSTFSVGTTVDIYWKVIAEQDLQNKELGRPHGPAAVTMSAIIKDVRWTISLTDNF